MRWISGNVRVDVIRVTRDSGTHELFRVRDHGFFVGEYADLDGLASVIDLDTLEAV